jgi:very-short-patch-repair endonuclease
MSGIYLPDLKNWHCYNNNTDCFIRLDGGSDMYFTKEYRQEVDQILKEMDPKLRELIEDMWEKLIEEKLELISQCETPIEKLLVLPLSEMVKKLNYFRESIIEANCLPQQNIFCNSKTFRVDFLVQVLLDNDHTLQFVIECDGHDFHEKTKEQAKRDRQRERHLQNSGYTVIRFTGSEIHEDPYSCCDELEGIILKTVDKFNSLQGG